MHGMPCCAYLQGLAADLTNAATTSIMTTTTTTTTFTGSSKSSGLQAYLAYSQHQFSLANSSRAAGEG